MRRVEDISDIENIRAQKSVSGYQISFTLLNSDPQSVLPQWDIKNAVAKFLNPFLQKFPHIDSSIDSQVIHYSSLKIKPKKKENVHYLRHQDLPRLINPIEAKLGSYVSLHSNLNFIVYVPSQKHTPLYITSKNGEIAESNAFLSPQWGGLMIYNVNKTSDGSHTVKIDMGVVMRIFMSQLKLLLGVKPAVIPEGCVVGEYSSAGVTKWEQVSLLRIKTIEYLTTSTITLTSLARLLEQISNMVIGDQIQKQVQQALLAIHKASCHGNKLSKEALEEGKLSQEHGNCGNVSLTSSLLVFSEKAFFDPSILALLYFPDDQKYAIYIPLFLPISLPIILSLISGIRWLKSGDQTKASDKKND
ncbi:hypothetical protein QZH41_020774 [Actinostola sp. cb2023]|nr:hypothetical protein QZH41_020774 [Actinostola sp. cb2023]